MSVEEPVSFEDLLAYIERYSATIYVRDFLDGEVGSYPLALLPAPRALTHAFRWIRQGVVPARIITRQESIETLAADAPDGVEPPQKEGEP